MPVLLEQVEGEIASVMADGAYDGEPVYRAIEARQPQAPPSIVIPPRRSAVLSSQADTDPSQRDGHIRLIQAQGRSAWRKATEYGKRSLVETAIGRYKALIGPRLRARTLSNQQGEMPDELPDTGAGGLALGASFPVGNAAAGLTMLVGAGYAVLRRK